MPRSVLLGDPSFFHIRSGINPHTRDRWGRRKKVDKGKALAQWNELKRVLESQGIKVHTLPPVQDQPGLVFPANAGFRYEDNFYLSNLNPAREGEKSFYRQALSTLGLNVMDFPAEYPFEGEADFIPLGDPSGDPKKTVYLFTYGRIAQPQRTIRWGFPPYHRSYGFRSDRRAISALEKIADGHPIWPLELVDEAHYHGDTVLYSFGPRREYLLAYLEGLAPVDRSALQRRLGDRLIPLSEMDGRRFAANSFQTVTHREGEERFVLFMPDGLTEQLYDDIRDLGMVPCPVDVSEFLEKGGGAVKCMLLDLGEL